MRCQRVRRLLTDYVDGVLPMGKARRIADHLAVCDDCRDREENARMVVDALSAWPEVDPPEDALHRMETRIAFSPPPPVRIVRPRIPVLALTYAAGLATAAVLLLVVLPLVTGPGRDAARSPDRPGVAADRAPVTELLPGEMPLRYVDERNDLIELDPALIRYLRALRERKDGSTEIRAVDAEYR